MTLACGAGCTQPDRHLSDCPCADPQHEHGEYLADQELGWATCSDCTGCLPRLAAPGLQVCPGCENDARRALTELPDLWVDLAERPRLAGVSRAPTGEDEPAAPANDDQIAERSVIKSILVTWCKVLEEDHAIGVPDERAIAATTRHLAAWHSDQARQTRDAANLLDMPTAGPLYRDAHGASALRREAATRAAAAAAVRDDRETGRDLLRAICEHLARHSGTLLAGPHAAKYTADLRDARHDARRRAYAGRPAGIRLPCPECGHRTRVTREQESMSCPACGAFAAITAWSGDTAAPPASPALEEDITAWMLASHRMDVKGPRIRQWASRGKLESVVRDDGRVGYDALVVCDLAYRMQEKRAS